MMLLDSSDPVVAQAAPILATGRKWTPRTATEKAKAALRHRDIVGQVQEGRGGLGLGASTPTWSKATPSQRRKLVVQEVHREEEAGSTASLKHILVGCKTSLTQGLYTWRHNQVLKSLAAVLESQRTSVNALPPPSSRWQATSFVREGEGQANLTSVGPDAGQLGGARDWKLLADLGQKLCFPAEIVSTNLRPDLAMWSASSQLVYIIELTVPWESSVEEAYERKG
ncbi:hypothetical protein N1851_022295 [Merluccius polli]|uniref:Uncharacterized protein n=1 Tax=Merluccius polli TaxID=89951 RepID=A0AA47MI20_MERPO|nr:hypothetical protein N1851_022295 [Merluccius polli]